MKRKDQELPPGARKYDSAAYPGGFKPRIPPGSASTWQDDPSPRARGRPDAPASPTRTGPVYVPQGENSLQQTLEASDGAYSSDPALTPGAANLNAQSATHANTHVNTHMNQQHATTHLGPIHYHNHQDHHQTHNPTNVHHLHAQGHGQSSHQHH